MYFVSVNPLTSRWIRLPVRSFLNSTILSSVNRPSLGLPLQIILGLQCDQKSRCALVNLCKPILIFIGRLGTKSRQVFVSMLLGPYKRDRKLDTVNFLILVAHK